MGKDFSNSTANVFSDFFSLPLQPVETVEKKIETKTAEVKKEVKTTPKKVDTPKQTETKKAVKTTQKKEKVEPKPAEEKKEVKVIPKKEETKKEITPNQTENVNEDVKTTPKTEEIKEIEIEKVQEVTPKKNKSRLKECRFDFYAEIEYADFLNNFLWLRRCKNYSQYFNNLVKKDFLEFLNLPADTSNEVLAQKWEEYKKENDL